MSTNLPELHPSYKCRMCGEIFQTTATTNTNYLDSWRSVDILFGKESMATLLDWHRCGENNRGIADLIGFSSYPTPSDLPVEG